MPKLKVLSGEALIKIFESFGFFVFRQRGSHIKLRRDSLDGKQILTVPLHQEIDRGTLREIFHQARRYISETDLRRHFYTE